MLSGPNVALKLDGKDSKYDYKVTNYESKDWSWDQAVSNSLNISPELIFSPHDITGLSLTYSQGYTYNNSNSSRFSGWKSDDPESDYINTVITSFTPGLNLSLNITQLAKMQYLVNLEKKKLNITNADLDLNIARQSLYFSILQIIMSYHQTEALIKTNEYSIADDEYNLEVNRTKYGENSAKFLDTQFDLDETRYLLIKNRQNQTIKENELYFYLGKKINDINIANEVLIEIVKTCDSNVLNYEDFLKIIKTNEKIVKLQNSVTEAQTELKQFPKTLIPEINLASSYQVKITRTETDKQYNAGTGKNEKMELDSRDDVYLNTLSASLTLNVPLEKYTTYKYQQDINKLNYIKSQKRLIQEQENLYLAFLNDRQKFNDNKQDITYLKQQLNRYQNELVNKKRLFQADLVNEFDVIKMEKKLEQIKAKYTAAVISSYYYARKLDSYFKKN